MTPTEQDNELREQITPLVIEAIENGTFDGYYGDQIADETWNFLKALITADRKRVALEAKLETAEHIQNTMVDEACGYCDEILPDAIPNYIAELKAQQEEV
jgi:hypothetical protein